jgi:hypothetical protein
MANTVNATPHSSYWREVPEFDQLNINWIINSEWKMSDIQEEFLKWIIEILRKKNTSTSLKNAIKIENFLSHQ